jgi:hypothetical protein
VGEANTAGLAIARQKLEHFRLGDFPHKEPGTAISLNMPIWFVGPEQGDGLKEPTDSSGRVKAWLELPPSRQFADK